MTLTSQYRVLADLVHERDRQDVKWGEQHHPDGTHGDYESLANFYRSQCDKNHKAGTGTWADIALEEFFEALAEEDTTKLRKELIQVAAVAVNWIEDIDSRSVS
jgi:hypothetical protein